MKSRKPGKSLSVYPWIPIFGAGQEGHLAKLRWFDAARMRVVRIRGRAGLEYGDFIVQCKFCDFASDPENVFKHFERCYGLENQRSLTKSTRRKTSIHHSDRRAP